MKVVQFFLSMTIAVLVLVFGIQHALAEDPIGHGNSETSLPIFGTVRNAEGQAIPDATITLEPEDAKTKISLKGVSDKDGRFRIKIILKRTWSGWILLVLLIPGVAGLLVAAVKEWHEKRKESKFNHADSEEDEARQGKVTQWSEEGQDTEAGKSASGKQHDNRFLVAFFNGLIWMGSLAVLAWLVDPVSEGISLFDQELTFDFYVPILGFIGALLYVLDLCRRGREDIPRGTEFGMRLIMGPYVAIMMVLLFGENLQFVDLHSPVAKAALAFFSGLLVVIALQGLIERGNEWLGRLRQRHRYEPSEVAKKFDLNQEEDLKLRKVGVLHLIQIRDCDEDKLREEVRKVGFDENLAVAFRKQLEEERLKKSLGDMVQARLKNIGVKTIQELSHLKDESLAKIADVDPPLELEDLKTFRDQAKKLAKPQ